MLTTFVRALTKKGEREAQALCREIYPAMYHLYFHSSQFTRNFYELCKQFSVTKGTIKKLLGLMHEMHKDP